METAKRIRFDFQRLDVYRLALKFAGWRRRLVVRMQPGNGDLVDQIGRASTSIVLNIAEGCGEFSSADRARFYRFARRSAAECAAVLDLLEEFEQFPPEALEDGRVMLDRIMAMMTALVKLSSSKSDVAQRRRSRRERSATPEP